MSQRYLIALLLSAAAIYGADAKDQLLSPADIAKIKGICDQVIGYPVATEHNLWSQLERGKIEPAIKLFRQECGGHADSEACKEQRDTLVRALNGFVSMAQKALALLDSSAGDADFQKQTAARRVRIQQDLQWAQDQLKAVVQ